MNPSRRVLACVALSLAAAAALAQDAVVFDMDTIRHKPTLVGQQEKKPAGTVELVEGKVGKAC